MLCFNCYTVLCYAVFYCVVHTVVSTVGKWFEPRSISSLSRLWLYHSSDEDSSLVFEDNHYSGSRNVSHQQVFLRTYSHPDSRTRQTHVLHCASCAVQCSCCIVPCCCSTVLCCSVLCCTVLYCAVLCCPVLCCAVLYCLVLYFTVLCCAVLCCVLLSVCYVLLCCAVLLYICMCEWFEICLVCKF